MHPPTAGQPTRSMNSSLHIFRRLSTSSTVGAKIKTLLQQSRYSEVLGLYSPLNANRFVFPSLLKACASIGSLRHGEALHSAVISMGFQFDPYIASSLINMYVKCGPLEDALQLFEVLIEREELAQDVAIWNSIIEGHFRSGRFDEGTWVFHRMLSLVVKPDGHTLCLFLSYCGDCVQGREIHGHVLRSLLSGDRYLETAVLDMYLRCGLPRDAFVLLHHLEDLTNVVAWNVMINGLNKNSMWEDSLWVYSLAKTENVKLDSSSFSTVLKACGCCEGMGFGKQVHCDVIKTGFQDDPYMNTSLLTMYAKCGLVEHASSLFEECLIRQVVSWNAIISAYVNNGCLDKAQAVYYQMRVVGVSPDSVTLSNVFSCCSAHELLDLGRSVHAELIKKPVPTNLNLQSSLLAMYSRCGSIGDAKLVFDEMVERDVVSWGSMMAAFCHNNKFEEALGFFNRMEAEGVGPDTNIFVGVIIACAGLEDVSSGLRVHGFAMKSGFDSDVFIASSLIDMYSKCHLPNMAASLFSIMPHRNLVAWNSMISCSCRNDLPELALEYFSQMVEQGICPDTVSITSILAATSSLAALLKGKSIHGYMIRSGILSDTQVKNALIDMYVKSGSLEYAELVFRNMSHKNLVTWNSLITGHGYHGDFDKSLKLFNEMRDEGAIPDNVTFMSLISSCRHSGLVEKGLQLFHSMREEYKIQPRMEDYVNIVDLLGRAGRLDDAYGITKGIPMSPDKGIWLCLLSACRIHGNVELGEIAAKHLFNAEQATGSGCIPLLNIYSEAELWDRAAHMRASMRSEGLKKNPGRSWIEMKDSLEVFYSGDCSSQRTEEIYYMLNCLSRIMAKRTITEECMEELWEAG
ncbi:hypothetical protein MLD38_011066 [Melastoma candidum]|uniref:Uncharacterized protein n=1 Tax=Melastoma candidum TaxID=119954 RepID=A0ACB9R1Z4_9MYRT|nr:hypothetical protein MLD38_011066 [Melastoma candidum]